MMYQPLKSMELVSELINSLEIPRSQATQAEHEEQKWSRPEAGWIKINTDSAVDLGKTTVGTGVIARDRYPFPRRRSFSSATATDERLGRRGMAGRRWGRTWRRRRVGEAVRELGQVVVKLISSRVFQQAANRQHVVAGVVALAHVCYLPMPPNPMI